MYKVMSFRASGIPREQLGPILGDYLALDRARILRRLVMVRCGVLAVAAGTLESAIHGFSPIARVLTVGLCLVPPACAWGVELGRSRRLMRASRDLGGQG